jgi:hypothetical protein
MSYPKIYEVLPKDIILQIQDYIEGEVIYIPKRSENKKSWGDCTDTKEILSLRNKKIYYDYCDGISVQQLAQKYFLAEKSIQRIIRYEKNNASCNYRSNLSNTPEFAEALVEDGQRILSLYNNLPVEKQTAFLTRIRQDSAHSFSDLIDATTNGQLHGNYGHSRNYWTRPGNLQAEAFAHFFEASMGDQGKLELLANFFPTAFGIFSSMIDSIRPDNHVRVLSRER